MATSTTCTKVRLTIFNNNNNNNNKELDNSEQDSPQRHHVCEHAALCVTRTTSVYSTHCTVPYFTSTMYDSPDRVERADLDGYTNHYDEI